MIRAIRAGYRGVDTACQPKHYREDLVGEALSILAADYKIERSSLFIQTKFTPIDGQDLGQPLPYDRYAPLTDQVLLVTLFLIVLLIFFDSFSFH